MMIRSMQSFGSAKGNTLAQKHFYKRMLAEAFIYFECQFECQRSKDHWRAARDFSTAAVWLLNFSKESLIYKISFDIILLCKLYFHYMKTCRFVNPLGYMPIWSENPRAPLGISVEQPSCVLYAKHVLNCSLLFRPESSTQNSQVYSNGARFAYQYHQ